LTGSLHSVDLVVLVAYFAAVVLLGIWMGRGQRQLSDYLLGGRDLPWWAILGSIVATETSTATFLSVPGIAYDGDLRFLQLAIGFIIGRTLVVYFLLPHYFRGNLFTAYQVLDRRFGGATKSTASLVFLLARTFSDGLRLFLAALVLEKILGWSMPACIVIIGIATIFYTFFGGIKSVIWNDCLQFVIYMAGGVLAGIVILNRLPGGLSEVAEFAAEQDKLRLIDFDFDFTQKYTFWAGVVGGTFLSLGTHGTDQMLVQRYLCARSQRDAGRALLLSGFVVLLQFTLFLLLGVALAAFYHRFEPPSELRPDEVFATFIVNELPAGIGLIGLTLAAVFAAAMSTLSSSLNSSASSAVNDLYLPLRRRSATPHHQIGVSRLLTVFFGIAQIGVAIAGIYLARSVVDNVLDIASFTAGLLLGLFALGVLTTRVGQSAALSGLLVGLAVLTVIKFLTPIAWPWYALIGTLTTFFAGLLASGFSGGAHQREGGSGDGQPQREAL
jgi:solute:Na+ symporter, SSS family